MPLETTVTNPEHITPGSAMYAAVLTSLRTAYDSHADERERAPLDAWKLVERERVLTWLRAAGVRTLLEIGAGTGKDALFFQQHGLAVTAVDQSPAMVAHCRRKGVRAEMLDFLSLATLTERFDAVYALNCLLHVPKVDLPAVLGAIRAVLHPGGRFYLGQYGGRDVDGVWPDDDHEPKRYFSYYPDDALVTTVRVGFAVEAFACIPVERGGDLHFQSLLLRRAP